MDPVERFNHASWITAASTAAGYGLILLAMFLVLFLIPYLVFRLL